MCNVMPGNRSPTQESLKSLIYGSNIYLSPIHPSSKVAHKMFSSLRPYKLNFQEASRDRRLGTANEVDPAILKGHQKKCLEE
uniref:Protein transport protein SEC23 n=1 Tax=Solanum lycopersicum TaxID=4081 RepID=A0A3Q7EVT7_SOLLC